MRRFVNFKFEIVLFLCSVGLLGVVFLGISKLVQPGPFRGQTELTSEQAKSTPDASLDNTSLGDRLSDGTQSLLPEPSQLKQQGISAYAKGDYAQAVVAFEAALQADKNDPETFIYLNNARIADRDHHTLAVIAPVGNVGEIGLEILRGAGQAQQDLNQRAETEGVPIRILIVNDENDADVAASLAKALVNRPDVLGVLGHYSSGVTLAAAPIYNRGKLPMMSAISTSVQLSGLSPYVFRTVPSDSFAAATLARYMLEDLGAQKAVLYYDSNSAYSLSLKSEFSTSVFGDGGEIITEYDLADPQLDAQAQIAAAQEKDADVIMLASSTDTLEPSLEVIAAAQQQFPLLGGDDLYHPEILKAGGENAEGLVVAVPWHVLSDADSEFVQASRQIWGGDVSWRTAMAYDALVALGTAGSQAPSREGIQTALADTNFSVQGATGNVDFLPSGDRNRAAQLVQIQSGQRSSFGFDFIPID
ncbi:MAG: ABC transporter substrate-binding protein [Cyanobacteria bacterium P01_A01_bin.114]